jgi:hypothetical protein
MLHVDVPVHDYHLILAHTLHMDLVTAQVRKEFRVTIDCPAPARAFIRFVENRPGTHLDEHPGSSSVHARNAFGLGLHRGGKIGSYVIEPLSAGTWIGDDILVRGMTSRNSGASWSQTSNNVDESTIDHREGAGFAAANEDRTAPGFYKKMETAYDIHTFVAPRSTLDLSDDIKLDGQFTVELFMI